MRGGAAKGFLEIGWDAVEGAQGYLVWFSDDGRTWPREEARLVQNTKFVAGALPDVPVVYVRVTALDAAGLESDPSVTMAASPSKDKPEVLLVDANQRWLSEPQGENYLRGNHDFLVNLGLAAAGRTFDSVRHEEIAEGMTNLSGYRAVVWAAGETSTVDKPVNAAEQAALKAYLAADGAVLFSGSELLWAFSAPRATNEEAAFASEVMRAGYAADNAGTYEFEGAAGSELQAIPATSFFTPGAMRIETPDVLLPAGGSVELLRYVGGPGGAAAVGYKGTGAWSSQGSPWNRSPAAPRARWSSTRRSASWVPPPRRADRGDLDGDSPRRDRTGARSTALEPQEVRSRPWQAVDHHLRPRVDCPRSQPPCGEAANVRSATRPPCTRISPSTPTFMVRVNTRTEPPVRRGGWRTRSIAEAGRSAVASPTSAPRFPGASGRATSMAKANVRRARRCANSGAGTGLTVSSCPRRESVAATTRASSRSHGASSRTKRSSPAAPPSSFSRGQAPPRPRYERRPCGIPSAMRCVRPGESQARPSARAGSPTRSPQIEGLGARARLVSRNPASRRRRRRSNAQASRARTPTAPRSSRSAGRARPRVAR